jgi:hypothetical protein
MCTGRSPFRADTTIASLRRVCDDAPRPIREINPDIPDWLAAIIDRLLQKDPDDRFQTAEEVAELLGKHLAHVQDPASTPFPGTIRPLKRSTPDRWTGRRQRWLVAGLVLLVSAVSLGVTEATGVTKLSATVVRIVTGEGTLVIEVDDPTVEVSLDGEELTISGAGLQEVRLRPGQYQFRATKDGSPVQQELVTIHRGDRQVVRVTRDGAAPPPIVAGAVAERGAFVRLGGPSVAERRFDTLVEAVQSASAGDTIEIRGNGPFVTDAINITSAVTIRAGAGFRPVLRRSPQSSDGPLFFADAALVLEGLTHDGEAGWFLGTREHGPPALLMANCRLTSPPGVELLWHRALRTQIRNCELLGGSIAVDWNCRTGGSHLIENCVMAAPFGISYGDCAETDVNLHDVSVTFRQNTVTGPAYAGLAIAFGAIPTATDGVPSIAMEVERNVFGGSGRVVHATYFVPQDHGETTGDMVAALNQLVAWNARQNLCGTDAQFLNMQLERTIVLRHRQTNSSRVPSI